MCNVLGWRDWNLQRREHSFQFGLTHKSLQFDVKMYFSPHNLGHILIGYWRVVKVKGRLEQRIVHLTFLLQEDLLI